MASDALAAASPTIEPGLPVFAHVDHDDWQETPIEAAWIVEGAPRARIRPLAVGRDGFASTALWECTPGTFRWQ